MEMLERTDLPYFEYGPFKPGEPAHYQIKNLISSEMPATVQGFLFVRDGMPMLEPSSEGTIYGYLLTFDDANSKAAYQKITDYYPYATHQWGIIHFADSGQDCNCVIRKPPHHPDYDDIANYDAISTWSAKDDPLFSKAIHIIAQDKKRLEAIHFDKDEGEKFDWNGYYELQMRYLLLWSILERFMSLNIKFNVERGSHGQSTIKQQFAGTYQPFSDACNSHISEKLYVRSYNNPNEYKMLQADQPQRCIEFFHRLRSNIIHRGKSAEFDGNRLQKSYIMLYKIVREILIKEGLLQS